ncbi:MAG: methyltransferase [Vicingaceae bacterium]
MKAKRQAFQFKQFSIRQDQAAMKVGTDGVLVGAWTDCSKAKRILDIGCGTGLLCLMLAQRCQAQLTGIEIEPEATLQAQQNVAECTWSERIKILEGDFTSFESEEQYDLIVCNPPYFNANRNRDKREQARQNISLPYPLLFEKVAEHLSPKGSFSLISPADRETELLTLGENQGLFPKRLLKVRGNHQAKIKRLLIEFTFEEKACEEKSLIIEKERHQYTEDYANLLREYLLIF